MAASTTSKIFLTGATGFVGGEAFHQVYASFAKAGHEISVLLRDVSKKAAIQQSYPKARIVEGDLDHADLIEKEAANANIVIHLASTNHEVSARAIARGLQSRKATSYWFQMSGASMFAGDDLSSNNIGGPPRRSYADIADAQDILAAIAKNPKRVVDQLVLSQPSSSVRTALLVGPLIYGTSAGPGHTKSIQAPTVAREVLKRGHSVMVGAGKSVWSHIHVHDLGRFVVSLVEAATHDQTDVWNDKGVYLVENGSLSFGELADLLTSEAQKQGLISSPGAPEHLTAEQADQVMPHGSVLLGTNALTKGERMRQSLGWKPTSATLQDTLEEVIQDQAAGRT